MTRLTPERVELLRQVPMFSGLGDQALEALAELAHVKELGSGEELFHKGDRGAQLYVIVSGRLNVGTTSPDGARVVFDIMDPGEVFGELALLSGGVRTGTVTAVEPAELLGIDRRSFLDLLRAQPDVSIELLAVLADRVVRISEQMEDRTFLNLEGRLAKQLLELVDDYGEPLDGGESGMRIDLELSQGALGEMVGTSRESINKQIKAWAREGVLEMNRGRIKIFRAEVLEGLAGTR